MRATAVPVSCSWLGAVQSLFMRSGPGQGDKFCPLERGHNDSVSAVV